MTHGGFSTIEQNKCRQCFDADPGRGEPKLDFSSAADPRSVLTSHKIWIRPATENSWNSWRSTIVNPAWPRSTGGCVRCWDISSACIHHDVCASRASTSVAVQHYLVNSGLNIKHEHENEVWLTFLYFSSTPSSRQDRYKTFVLSKVPSPAQSWAHGGTPDMIRQKKERKNASNNPSRCFFPHHDK